MIEQPPHELELMLARLPEHTSPDLRLEVIWQWYERQAGVVLDRPPTEAQRLEIVRLVRAETYSLYQRRPTLRLQASMTLAEKAGSVVQAQCLACEPLNDPAMPTLITVVDVEPWSSQSATGRALIRKTVNERLQSGARTAWTSPVCLSVVSFVPTSSKTKDVDNLVKGLLDSLEGVLYDNDRQVQCLTSRRIDYAGGEGYYLLRVSAVHPWGADVVIDDGKPSKRLSRAGRVQYQ